MNTLRGTLGFYTLSSTLTDTPENERTAFLSEIGIDQVADLLIEDNPSHTTLLKRIVELLTLIPMEERYLIEEIATTANYKSAQQLYHQTTELNEADNIEQLFDDEQSDYLSPA